MINLEELYWEFSEVLGNKCKNLGKHIFPSISDYYLIFYYIFVCIFLNLSPGWNLYRVETLSLAPPCLRFLKVIDIFVKWMNDLFKWTISFDMNTIFIVKNYFLLLMKGPLSNFSSKMNFWLIPLKEFMSLNFMKSYLETICDDNNVFRNWYMKFQKCSSGNYFSSDPILKVSIVALNVNYYPFILYNIINFN